MFKVLNREVSLYETSRFITFLEIEILFSIKQCPLKVMSGNKLWSTKGGAKLLLDLLILSIFSSDTPLDFHDSI